jgi:hypothetical protein
MPEPSRRRELVRSLARIAARFEEADRRTRHAQTLADREDAEAERREANGAFRAAGKDLGELFLLLFRHALAHRPEALQMYLADALRPELAPVLEALAKLEVRP